MKSIRIQNMRCLKDTKTVELKPINILVGNNSSGKSTFLRLFPLMKQSFLRRINGPILWAGDDGDDVDFGSFRETLNNNSESKEIKLEFEVPFNIKKIIERMLKYKFWDSKREKYNINKNAKLIICIKSDEKLDNDYISKFFLECDGKSIVLDNVKNCFYYNNEVIYKKEFEKLKENESREFYAKRYKKDLNAFFDLIEEKLNFNILNNFIKKKIFSEKIIDSAYYDLFFEEIVARIYAEAFLNNQIQEKEFVKEIKKELRENDSSITESMKRLKIEINSQSVNEEKILNYMNIVFMAEVATFCMEYIYMYFLNVNYIKPVRAHAERYYRLRNLSVNQIDSDGKNLPIFIKSLSDEELESYNIWLYGNFGFKVEPSVSSGHVSINIKVGEQSINMSDTGYGYSQLLPIITQIWVALNTKKIQDIPIIFAIEQLELHLHPELQAKLIDVIIKIVKNKKEKMQFILETHSETVINRIGNLIYKNKISADNVNVVVFNKKMIDKNTEIKISTFNNEGYLQNWPIGFFGVEEIK